MTISNERLKAERRIQQFWILELSVHADYLIAMSLDRRLSPTNREILTIVGNRIKDIVQIMRYLANLEPHIDTLDGLLDLLKGDTKD